jgi:hypothetical protein
MLFVLFLKGIHSVGSAIMKGGKSGKRKSSSTRTGGKPKPRAKGVKHDWTVPPKKNEKKTTRLGAVRVPDDN